MNNGNLLVDLVKVAEESAGAGFAPLLECLLNGLMQLQRQHHLGAAPYERTETRQDYANGYKERTFGSCCGPIQRELRIRKTHRSKRQLPGRTPRKARV